MTIPRKTFLSLLAALLLLGAGVTPPGRAKDRPPSPFVPGPNLMGRLRTIGWEIGLDTGTNEPRLEGFLTSGTTNASISTLAARSGSTGLRFDLSTGIGGSITLKAVDTATNGVWYYHRIYVRFTFPAAIAPLINFKNTSGTSTAGVRVVANGLGGYSFQGWNESAGAAIGSMSTTLVSDQWYRLEVGIQINSSTNDDAVEFRVDGVTIGTTTTANWSALGNIVIGPSSSAAGGSGFFIDFDDFACNDNTGATQNSWPGEGKIVLLKPISDNARGTNWFEGTSATVNLWDAVNNGPPVGVASSPANGTLKQIRNAVSDAAGNYDANLTSYSTAGIASVDTVTLVQPVFSTGVSSTTTTNAAGLMVSNPSGGSETTFVANNASSAAGTWPSGWLTTWLPATVGDIASGSRAASPVMRIGKRTATTRVVMSCLMGTYCEYVTGVAGPTPELIYGMPSRRNQQSYLRY